MKNTILVSGCACAVMALAPVANAAGSMGGLFLEPSVSYEVGDTSVNYPSPLSRSDGSAKGFGIGARAGFHLGEAFFLGLDVRYSMPRFLDSSVNYDAKSVSINWGPVAGLQIPDLGARVWASFVMGGNLDPDSSGGLDVKFQDAMGYRAGGGFRFKAVSINLEYQKLEYGQANLEQLGPFATSSTFNSVKLESEAWIASVSFPLEL